MYQRFLNLHLLNGRNLNVLIVHVPIAALNMYRIINLILLKQFGDLK